MKTITSRKILLLIAFICIISVIYAFYAEFYLKFEPCPLCIAQRVIIIVLAILSIIFAIFWPNKPILSRIYGVILTLIAAFGIKVAAHHIWLINLPPNLQPMSCGMPLSILYKRVPLHTFVSKILAGSAECTEIKWKIFGWVNPPLAVVILCSIIVLLSLVMVLRKSTK